MLAGCFRRQPFEIAAVRSNMRALVGASAPQQICQACAEKAKRADAKGAIGKSWMQGWRITCRVCGPTYGRRRPANGSSQRCDFRAIGVWLLTAKACSKSMHRRPLIQGRRRYRSQRPKVCSCLNRSNSGAFANLLNQYLCSARPAPTRRRCGHSGKGDHEDRPVHPVGRRVHGSDRSEERLDLIRVPIINPASIFFSRRGEVRPDRSHPIPARRLDLRLIAEGIRKGLNRGLGGVTAEASGPSECG